MGREVSRIAIMQPYFMPYAGYFRLFLESDLFVFYDDVQFPKEGWVHRNRLLDRNGNPSWLTLPLRRMPLSTQIRNLVFDDAPSDKWAERMRRFPVLENEQDPLVSTVVELGSSPVDYLINNVRFCCKLLDIPCTTIRSSEMELEAGLKGQERVLAIVQSLGGKEYINAPGGRSLYDSTKFDELGLKLLFLPEYKGSQMSILQRLLTENVSALRQEISASSQPIP